MPTVVVQAHPVPDSFNAALLERVVSGLETARVDHTVHRLCQADRPSAQDLAGADELILVYPTWWGGQPAALLEWLQDMLAERALGTVSSLTAVTSLGSSRLINRVQGEWGRVHLSGLVLQGCAPEATFEWLPLYKIDRQPQDAIDAHLDRVEARFSGRIAPRVTRPSWQKLPSGKRPPAAV